MSGLVGRGVAVCGAVMVMVASVVWPVAADPVDSWVYETFDLAGVHQSVQGAGVTVCVLDDAIDVSVPDLQGADVVLKASGPTWNGTEYVFGQAQSYPGYLYADHGTAMASMIVGQGNGNGPGGTGILGAAPRATLWFYQFDLDPTTVDSQDANGVSNGGLGTGVMVGRAAADGCDVISLSFSGGDIPQSTFALLAEHDAILLMAGEPNVPSSGNLDLVLVGAGTAEGKVSTLTEGPQYPDVMGPGEGVACGGKDGPVVGATWDSTKLQDGSSCATSFVAGALALVWSKYPDATKNQVLQALVHSPGGSENFGFNPEIGWGPVSIKNMLNRDPRGWPDVNPMTMDRQEVYDQFPESSWQDPAQKVDDEASGDDADAQEASGTNGDDTQDDGGVAWWVWLVGAVILVVAAGAAAPLLVRRRHRDDTPSLSTGPPPPPPPSPPGSEP